MRRFIFTLPSQTSHEQFSQIVKILKVNLRDTITIVQVPNESPYKESLH